MCHFDKQFIREMEKKKISCDLTLLMDVFIAQFTGKKCEIFGHTLWVVGGY